MDVLAENGRLHLFAFREPWVSLSSTRFRETIAKMFPKFRQHLQTLQISPKWDRSKMDRRGSRHSAGAMHSRDGHSARVVLTRIPTTVWSQSPADLDRPTILLLMGSFLNNDGFRKNKGMDLRCFRESRNCEVLASFKERKKKEDTGRFSEYQVFLQRRNPPPSSRDPLRLRFRRLNRHKSLAIEDDEVVRPRREMCVASGRAKTGEFHRCGCNIPFSWALAPPDNGVRCHTSCVCRVFG